MEEDVMKRIKPLETETLKILKGKCPLESSYLDPIGYQYYNQCLQCPYFIAGKGDGSCGWYEYRTEIVNQRSHIEDDEFGADVPSDYYKTIKCAHCGSPVEFYSSFSTFTKGDKEKCPHCGLLHTFLKTEKDGDNYVKVFAIPIKEWEAKQAKKNQSN